MKSHKYYSLAMVATALFLAMSPARAALTSFSDRSAFSLSGAIVHNYGFEDQDTTSDGYLFPAIPWTAFDVTYTAGANLIVGPTLGAGGQTSNVFTNNVPGGPVTGTIAGAYDLFGFDLGGILASNDVSINVTTNLGVYSFLSQSLPGMPSLSFFGYRADAGEYFTAFSITSSAESYSGMDNVTLGNVTAAIPEPEIYAMMLAGLGFLGWAGKRRKRQTA